MYNSRVLYRIATAASVRRSPKTAFSIPIRSHARLLATATEASKLMRTGLYDFHLENDAQMVPFAGFSMPLLYGKSGQVASHKYVRDHVGLFDVGHMVQSFITGPSANGFLEWLTPSSLSSLAPFSSTLSVFLNEQGGIIDDTIICKHSEEKFYVVTNAARRDRDIEWIRSKLSEWNEKHRNSEGVVRLDVLDNWGLIALQGPEAAAYLQTLTSYDLPQLTFGKSAYMNIGNVQCHVARGGYTGEDGFEISIPPGHTVAITKLLSRDPVQLIGLAARDSLRLEAGMCLYGHDLDETTSPVEANLNWVIGKDRRQESSGFIGAEIVLGQLKNGVARKRVGLVVEDAPAREGAKILHPETLEEIGIVTSGIPSPSLSRNIAMGYIQTAGGFNRKGKEVKVQVRGKPRNAVVQTMPFVPTRYWRGVSP